MGSRPEQICIAKSNSLRSQLGFTLLELLVTLSVLGIMGAIAAPRIVSVHAQMRASHDARAFASKLSTWRGEATRLRRNVAVSITPKAGPTRASVGVDFDNDGMLDDWFDLSVQTDYRLDGMDSTPYDFTVNGLGLVPALPPEGFEIEFHNRSESVFVRLYPTGVIQFEGNS